MNDFVVGGVVYSHSSWFRSHRSSAGRSVRGSFALTRVMVDATLPQ